MKTQKSKDGFVERPGWAGAGYVLIGLILISVVLAFHLGYRYTTFLGFVKDTLQSEENPPRWETDALTPEQCVDESLQWAAECHGIKSLCDMYVAHVVELCMDAEDRTAYCEELAGRSTLTEFGYEECQARGVQRHIDNEACANAYRQIDTHCNRILQRRDVLGDESAAPDAPQAEEGANP